jgi:hypothetical protein
MTEPRARSRHTTTIVLVALAGAAGAWLLVGEKGRVTSEERVARSGRVFAAWRSEDVTRITLVSSRGSFTATRDRPDDPESRSFTLESAEGKVPADPQSVERVLSSLDLASARREVVKSSVDRSAMGLDAPRLRVEVAMGNLVARLAVGNDALPASDGVYAEVDGDRVVVVPSALVEVLDIGPDALRDRKIAPYVSPELVAITLREGDADQATQRFERAPWPASRGTAFRLAGGGPRVDARAFRSVVEGLGSLEAEVLLEEEPAPESAKVVVTLTPKEGAEATLALGAPCPGHPELVVAVRRAPRPLASCVKPEAIAPFVAPRATLADRHLFGTSRDELVEVKVEVTGKPTLEMARRGTGFFVRRPSEGSVPDEAARGFIDAITNATGDLETVDDASLAGEGAATLRVISRPVTDGDPERIETVSIGPARDGRRAVRRAEDGAGLWVPDASVRPLLLGALMLQDRKIIDVATEKVREVAILRPGAPTQRVRRTGSGVELVEPRGTGLAADEPWGRDLLDRCAQLTAVRWVAETDDGSFGVAVPHITLEIHVEDELGKPESERTERVVLGTPTDDGPFARIVGKDAVFLASPDLARATRRLIVDRASFSIRTDDVKRVLLRAGDGPAVELVRRDGALLPPSPDAAASTRAAKLREALDELSAIAAVTLDEAKEQGLETPVLAIEVTPTEGRPFRVAIGAADVTDGVSVHFARRSDVGATFAVPQSAVRALLEALR